MAISGRLSETNLPSLLQVLSQSKKSGRLSLTRTGARAVILLREGKLIYAASSSVQETLGNILVCEKLIDEQTLIESLERQHAAKNAPRLGTVLVDMGAIEEEALSRVLEEQALKVLSELVHWSDGFFKFDTLDVSEEGLLDFDLGGFLVDHGLRVDRMLLDLAELEDRASAEAPDRVSEDPAKGGISAIGLREVAASLGQPMLNAEMTVALLRYAAARVDRALLLLRREGHLVGIAQAGVDFSGGSPDAQIRKLRIPLDQPSLFSRAVNQHQVASGRLDVAADSGNLSEGVHSGLVALLGTAPSDAVAVPMVVQNQVAFVLYGDVQEGKVEASEDLEVLMMQAGLSMEKAILERRVEELEKTLQGMPEGTEGVGELGVSSSLISQLLEGRSET